MTTLEETFTTVLSLIREAPSSSGEEPTSTQDRLRLYGLFKHIRQGPCDGRSSPPFHQTVARAKYHAWKSVTHYTRDQAMMEYMQIMASQNHSVGRQVKQLLEESCQLTSAPSPSPSPPLQQQQKQTQEKDETASESSALEEDTSHIPATDKLEQISEIATSLEESDVSRPSTHQSLNERCTELRRIGTNEEDLPTSDRNSSVTGCDIWSLLSRYATYLVGLLGIQPLIARGTVDISYTDIAFALWQCLSSRFYNRNDLQLKSRIRDLWNADAKESVVVGLSVRSLLDLYLCAKRFPENAQVIIIPPITVPGMIHVLQYHNLSIVPVDGVPGVDVQRVRRAITDKTVAIMVVHTFGMICASDREMKELRALADAQNVELWEDCAECFTGLGPNCYKGSALADIRFFSFGLIKTSTAVGGGIAILQNRLAAEQMDRLQNSFYKGQTSIDFTWRLISCLKVKFFGDSPLCYGVLAAFCSATGLDFDHVVTSSLRSFPIPSKSSDRGMDEPFNSKRIPNEVMIPIRKRPSYALLSLLQRRLTQSRYRAPSINARIKRCRYFLGILRQTAPSVDVILGPNQDLNTFWLFPIKCRDRDKLRRQAQNFGFDVTNGASQLCCVSSYLNDGEANDCSLAEGLMDELLYLPVACHGLSVDQMKKLAEAFQCSVMQNGENSQKMHSAGGTSGVSKTIYSILNVAFVIVISILLSGSPARNFRNVLAFLISNLILIAFGLSMLRWFIAPTYLDSSCFAKYSSMVKQPCYTNHCNNEQKDSDGEDVIGSIEPLKLPARCSLEDGVHGRVLITGATGFVGSLLLRDLLLHRKVLSILGGVIVLCRKKKGLSAQARILKLLAQPMFSFLNEQEKRQLVDVVEGDVTEPKLGLKASDAERIYQDTRISHVFHCAASVNFMQSLQDAAKANITSSLNVQAFTARLKRKDVQLVHISTAFVHGRCLGTSKFPLPESLYSLHPYKPADLYKSMLGSQFYASKALNDLGFPNTYTFSKCICEHLLLEERPVSTIIIRPSIVGPAVQSPFEGWAGDKPSTIVAGACLYLSFQWNLWCLGNQTVPYIPVDVLSRFILSKAFSENNEEDCCLTNESSTTDDSFERISRSSESSSNCPDGDSDSAVNEKNCRHSRIYNATWNTNSASDAMFSWLDFAVVVTQLGSNLSYFDKATSYVGLIIASQVMPWFDPTQELYEKLHSLLVMLPLTTLLDASTYFGRTSSQLKKLLPFLDLPVLFFPFTKNSYHFESELRAPTNLNGEKYLFSCVVSAHQLIKAFRPQSLKTCNEDMSAYILGGNAHRGQTSDIWWALNQPRGTWLVRLAGYIVMKMLRACCSVLTVDIESFASALAAVESGENSSICLILAPTHRSLFDFILLSFVLFSVPELGIGTPNVAAADDFERLPIICWLARYLGAFYIKRGRGMIDPELGERLKVLKSNQLRKTRSCLEVFIEGGRSRDRRFLDPKTGFLRCLHQSGGSHLVVPLTISYECIPEQTAFAKEASGAFSTGLSLDGMFRWFKVDTTVFMSKTIDS